MTKPTAMQEVADEQETEKPWALGLWGAGTDCRFQVAAPAAGAATSRITAAAHRASDRLTPAATPERLAPMLPPPRYHPIVAPLVRPPRRYSETAGESRPPAPRQHSDRAAAPGCPRDELDPRRQREE